MRTHTVEVDDEVFSFVKSHAEPLVDNFNSVLRRFLPLEKFELRQKPQKPQKSSYASHSVNISSLPTGTPTALRQILEVVQLVRGGVYTRTAATQYVAKQHKVFPQTVLDKYCRQLNLTAKQFDRFLEKEKLSDLKELLRSKFPEYSDIINLILE